MCYCHIIFNSFFTNKKRPKRQAGLISQVNDIIKKWSNLFHARTGTYRKRDGKDRKPPLINQKIFQKKLEFMISLKIGANLLK